MENLNNEVNVDNVNNTENKQSTMKETTWKGVSAVLNTVHTATVATTKLTEQLTASIGTRLTELDKATIISEQRSATQAKLDSLREKQAKFRAAARESLAKSKEQRSTKTSA